MIRIFRLFLAFLLFFTGLVSYSPAVASNSDITGHWAFSRLQEWIDKGLIKGYTDGRIKPDHPITRAEFAALANKAFGFVQEGDGHFPDVSPNSWYAKEIKKATAAGYIKGYGDGTFRPDRYITREEAAVMLDRLLQLDERTGPWEEVLFADMGSVSLWSLDAVKRVAAAGVVRGYTDQTFKPQNNISRAEAVIMLSNGTGEIVHQEGTYGSENGQHRYAGNVTVTAGNVKLLNAVIQGDLLLAESVGDEDVILENVIVEGQIRIAGGGANSIYITGSSHMPHLYVNKKMGPVRIVLRDNVQVGTITLQTRAFIINETVKGKPRLFVRNGGNDESEFQGDFEEVGVDSSGSTIRFRGGNVDRVTVSGDATDSEMTLDDGQYVGHMVLNSNARIYGRGRIGQAEITANGVNIERSPQIIKINDGLTAIIEGKVYPPETDENTSRDGGGDEGGRNDDPIAVTGIRVDSTNVTLKVGETATLVATITPANATNKNVTWSSDDEAVASVVNGVVTAKAAGTATITVTTVDGGFKATSKITVYVPAKKPVIESAEITPENKLIITFDVVTNQSGVLADSAAVDAVLDLGSKSLGTAYSGEWSVVGDKSVLTIEITDATGRTLDTGDTISIKPAANVKDENNTSDPSDASATVNGSWVVAVTGVTLTPSDVTLKVNETATLTATVQPANASNKSVTWSSDNESVASVVNGVVTAKAAGTATITVTTVDGGFNASTHIHVRDGRADVTISDTIIEMYPFEISIRNTFDEYETKVDGNRKVTVMVEFESTSAVIFDGMVSFHEGDATVTLPAIPNPGTYRLVIQVEGIWDPLVIPDAEVIDALEAVLEAQTAEELHRALLALGMARPGEFNSSSIETVNLQAYLEELAISNPQTAAEVQERIDAVNDRTIAPKFAAGHPYIEDVSDIEFTVRLKMNKKGTIYFLVAEDDMTAPTPEQVRAGVPYAGAPHVVSGSRTLEAAGNYRSAVIGGVATNTAYKVYLVTESAGGALSDEVTVLEVTTKPPIVPEFIEGMPRIDGLRDTGFTFTMRVHRSGYVYYMVVEDGVTPPTPEQVRAGQAYGDVTPITVGSTWLQNVGYAQRTVSDLQPDTKYVVFFATATIDELLNEQLYKLEVTTLPHVPAEFVNNFPMFNAVSDYDFNLIFAATKEGTAYYLVVPRGAAAPTSEQVRSGGDGYTGEIAARGSAVVYDRVAAFSTVTGLTGDAEYDVYAVIEDKVTGWLQPEPTKRQVRMMPDQAPGFVNTYPKILEVTDDYFTFGAFIRKPGYVYYMVTEEEAAPPTSEEVKAGTAYRGVVPIAAGLKSDADLNPHITVGGLMENTRYKLYIVTESLAGTLSELPAVLEVTTPYKEAARFVSGHPSAILVSIDQFQLTLYVTREETVHYMVVPRDSAAPTAEELKAGEAYRGVTPIVAESLTADSKTHVLVTGLTPDTRYDVYAVIEDAMFGLQTPAHISVKMEPDKIEYFQMPQVHSVTDSGFSVRMGIRKSGVAYVLVLPAGEPAPTSQQVKDHATDTFNLIANAVISIEIKNLMPETAYDVYVAVTSVYGTLQDEPIKLEVETAADSGPPTFIPGAPYLKYQGHREIEFGYRLNKIGMLHYIVVRPEDPVPTPEQVVEGVSYSGVTIIQSNQLGFIEDHTYPSEAIEELEPGATYVIYMVTRSMGGSVSSVYPMVVTTLP